jgi:uncharacterized membrane protein YgaE (UPF0421/DUF939 family)
VVIGVAIGDLFVALVGSGPWQIGAVVAVAVILAIAFDGSSTIMTQAGGAAVLIVALQPVKPDLDVPRAANAALGGAVGLLVYLVLFPLNPVRLIKRRAHPVIDVFATELATVVDALSARDLNGVESALHRLRDADAKLRDARDALSTARVVVTLVPARRHDRPILVGYSTGFEFLERAPRESRATVRRT